ncbi:MAG: electron transport complex subunit RsxC [Verrucomicrobia bacterium]|nr:electron transport complex subunit RsxC [Verrucomicrobiota bacterium]MBT7064803.1 electron transport complex subunit RsxC [Verrucomicrobiota bacterium]MBT7702467.1 electron transport complex subunit RsxC [Verrucomicrobiota bacterium]
MGASTANFRAPGGIHPAYHKDLAAEQPIAEMPLPAMLVVSMSQHLGKPAEPTVKKGDTVLRGQVIGEAAGFISAAVHAPTSGTVKLVAAVATAAGPRATAITIVPDGEDTWVEGITPCPGWQTLDKKAIAEKIAAAGITGMGGAGFPTHVKVSPPPEAEIDTLILNGAECEPYLTADYRLMIEHAARIWEGALIIAKALEATTIRVAIEDNKPQAIAAMQDAIPAEAKDAQVVVLKTEYPQGAEKQQIFAITGREVPCGGLPLNVGIVVENVGTTLAVWEAVVNGLPLTERVTTVTGGPIATPGNVKARLGTSYADLVEFCGGTSGTISKIISGGPMMGFAQPDLACGTTKTTSGLLLLGPDAVQAYESMPCISCGRCVGVCPMKLMPNELSQFLEAEDYETAEAYNVMDCIECGCCAFECPAHRPLVQHMRRGKAQVMLIRRKQAS